MNGMKEKENGKKQKNHNNGEAVPVDNEEIMRRMNDPEDTTVVAP
jgi:hypothetical protein